MTGTLTIYLALLDEGTDCWCPIEAVHVDRDLYKIVEAAPEDERRQFKIGNIVRCQKHEFQDGAALVTVEVGE